MGQEEAFRRQCANLSDGQLIDIVVRSSGALDLQAEGILYDEFLRRGMDTSLFAVIHQPHFIQEEMGVNGLTGEDLDKFFQTLWKYIATQQQAGVALELTANGLRNMGLKQADTQFAFYKLERLSHKLLSQVDACWGPEMMTACFFMVITPLMIMTNLYGFAITLLVVAGIVFLLYSNWAKERGCKAVLAYIEIVQGEI